MLLKIYVPWYPDEPKYINTTYPKRKESLDFHIFVQKYTILKYFQYTLYLSD